MEFLQKDPLNIVRLWTMFLHYMQVYFSTNQKTITYPKCINHFLHCCQDGRIMALVKAIIRPSWQQCKKKCSPYIGLQASSHRSFCRPPLLKIGLHCSYSVRGGLTAV